MVGCALKIGEMSSWCGISATFALLRFGAQFNQSLSQTVLPEELRSLTFGWRFNHDGTQFPKKLESLTFGHHFCQSVAGVDWPESLQCLSFGFWFNPSLQLYFCTFCVCVRLFDQVVSVSSIPSLCSLRDWILNPQYT